VPTACITALSIEGVCFTKKRFVRVAITGGLDAACALLGY